MSIRGAVETAWDGTTPKLLFNLPEGFRPLRSIYKICAMQGTRLARLYLQNNGNIFIEWVAVIADGSSATGTYWFDISFTFDL